MNKKVVCIASLCVFSLAICADAAFIVGSIGFSGTWLPDTGNIATATTILIGNGNTANVLDADGDFAPAASDTGVPFNDIAFSPFAPITPLWGPTPTGAFTFDLLTLSIDFQDPKELALSGTGTVKGTGFDDTVGFWSWSGDTSGGGLFVWSSTTTTIPEPGTIAVWSILGLSGLGIVVFRRRLA